MDNHDHRFGQEEPGLRSASSASSRLRWLERGQTTRKGGALAECAANPFVLVNGAATRFLERGKL
jgi:hypothetical protein